MALELSQHQTRLSIDRRAPAFLYWLVGSEAGAETQGEMMMMERILGLDVGDVRIGVAVSDGLGVTAQAVSTIHRHSLDLDFQKLQKLLDEYETRTILVGYPLNMDGSVGSQAEKVKAFADALSSRLDAKTILWDERLTTSEARRALITGGMRREKRKLVIDQAAAVILLQSYLDAQCGSSGSSPTNPEESSWGRL
jgi:putative Holliday junction resolvase